MHRSAKYGKSPPDYPLSARRPMRHRARVGINRQRLATAILARRVALGITSQEALATRAHVSQRTVGTLERGGTISDTKLIAVLTALGCTSESIVSVINDGTMPVWEESVDPERDALRAAFDAYIAAGHSDEDALAMLRTEVQRRNAITRTEQRGDVG